MTIQRQREFQPRELLDGPARRAPASSLFKEQPEMSRASKAFVVLMMGVMGLWGCAQGPANGPTAERIKSLETKCAKLDEDYKAATEARDLLKKKLAALETEKNRLQQDRDEQTRLVKERTTERDGIQTQYDQFRGNLKNLLGQAEAALVNPPAPMTTVAESPAVAGNK
jgi:FtsZ-binding cell division protein ZapB